MCRALNPMIIMRQTSARMNIAWLTLNLNARTLR